MRRRLWGFAWVVGAALWPAVVYAHLPSITLSSKYLNVVAAPGTNPAVQTVRLGTNEHPYQWTAAVVTARGGPWLSVTPNRGSFVGDFQGENLRVSVAAASLAPGVYYGTITINAPAAGATNVADNNPQVIEVALNVTTTGQAAPGFAIAPEALSFEGVRGSGRDAVQSLQVRNVGGGSLNWTATAGTTGGGNWLSLSPVSGTNTVVLNATAAVANLATGTYTGRITFTAPQAANSPLVIPVTFLIRDPLPPALVLTPGTVTFTGMAETLSPPSQTLVITNGGEGTLAWRVAAATFNGGPWLSATPTSGAGRGVVTLSAELGSLPAGTYAGRLTVTADGAQGSPVQIPVTFTVRRAQPTITRLGVVNAATFQPTPVAPGEIVSLFGARLGPAEGVASTPDPDTRRLPETLAGTKVTFDGVGAPLFYVSERQVNLQVPFEVARRTSSRMVVTVEGLDPAELAIEVGEAVPGLFTMDGTRAAALNQDFTLNTPDNPATVGSVVQLFLTGQGLLTANVMSGAPAPLTPPFPQPALEVAVTIDALNAPVRFAGLAPGFVGLTQLNVEIPRGVSPGPVRVWVAFGVHQAVKPAIISVQ